MDKVMFALQQLIKTSVDVSWSPLEGVKRVYFWDPTTNSLSSTPAIVIRPVRSNYTLRWSRYDQKECTIQVILIYNQLDYFDNFKWPSVVVSSASWSWGVATITSATPHWLSVGQDVQISEIDPNGYNGTYHVLSVIDPNNFTYTKPVDPWTYVSWGTLYWSNIEIVYAVKQAIERVEVTDANQHTLENTICWIIQQNSTLPYNNWVTVKKTCELAKVISVDYTFSMARGYPTFEVVVTMTAQVIWDR